MLNIFIKHNAMKIIEAIYAKRLLLPLILFNVASALYSLATAILLEKSFLCLKAFNN